MAGGTTTISGSFGINDTAGIKAFVESIITKTMVSGANVFAYPDSCGQGVYVGVAEGGFSSG